MNYRAVFSDIDGTLLTDEHRISPRTLTVSRRLTAAGIPFILVSARPPLAITPYSTAVGDNLPLIAFNGALILDGALQALYSVTLGNDDLKRLMPLLESTSDVFPNYYRGTEWFSSDPENDWTRQEGEITALRAAPLREDLQDIHKILVMGEAEAIVALQRQLQPQFPHLQIHRSKATYLEIVSKSATKAQAIQFMEEKLGVRAQEVIAFGDNYNDLDMLRYAGYSVAMGNAPEDIRRQVRRVTADNNHDGLAEVLEELFPELMRE